MRQLGRGGKLGAPKHRDFRLFGSVSADLDSHFAKPLIGDDLTADQESVALIQARSKAFFNLAQRTASAPAKADFQQIAILNCADIHSNALRRTRIAQMPISISINKPLPLIVSPKGIASGRGEIETTIEILARKIRIGAAGFNLFVKRVG